MSETLFEDRTAYAFVITRNGTRHQSGLYFHVEDAIQGLECSKLGKIRSTDDVKIVRLKVTQEAVLAS